MRKNSNTTAYRESLRLKIIDTAMPLFKSNGVKAVKMDDIATLLQISKRTLYEIYSNKEDLLYEGIKHDSETFQAQLSSYAETTDNEMDVIAYFLKSKLKDFDQTIPSFYTGIHKYKRIVEYLQNAHEGQKQKSKDFFKRGIAHGFFRDDLNYEIVHKILEAAMDYVMHTEMYKIYSLKEILHTFIIVYMRVCCTVKGTSYLDELMRENKESPE